MPRKILGLLFSIFTGLCLCQIPAYSSNTMMYSQAFSNTGIFGGHVRILKLAPSNSSILYAITKSGNLLRSTDAGGSWESIKKGLGDTPIFDIAIDNTNADTIYVANKGSGIFKSIDRGGNWVAINNGIANFGVNTIAISPLDSNILYAGTDDPDGDTGRSSDFYKSTDGGNTWVRINGWVGGHIVRIVIDASNPARIYEMSNPVNSSRHNLARSNDGGQTWSILKDPKGEIGSSFFDTFDVDKNSGDLFVSRSGIYKSTDGGQTWSEVPTSDLGISSISGFILGFNNPETFYVFGEGGISKTTDNGASYTLMNEGLYDPEVETMIIDPTTPSIMYVGTNESGIFKSSNGGSTWTNSSAGMTDLTLTKLIFDPLDTQIVYTISKEKVFKSLNGGVDWDDVSNGLTHFSDVELTSIAVDPQNNNILYLGSDAETTPYGNGGLFRSQDSGNTWQNIYAKLGVAWFDYVEFLVIDSKNPSTLMVGLQEGLYKSIDHGESWSKVSAVYLSDLVVNPIDSNIIYGTDTVFIRKSTDQGINWTEVFQAVTDLENDVMGKLFIDPINADTVYFFVNGKGVYRGTDAGKTWATVNDGLTDLKVRHMAVHSSGTLYVVTENEGIFKSTNHGDSWVAQNVGLEASMVDVIAVNPKTNQELLSVVAGQIYKSTNGAECWFLITEADCNTAAPTATPVPTAKPTEIATPTPKANNGIFLPLVQR